MSVNVNGSKDDGGAQAAQLGQVLAGNTQPQAQAAAPTVPSKANTSKGANVNTNMSFSSAALSNNPSPLSADPEAEAIKSLQDQIKELVPKTNSLYAVDMIPVGKQESGRKLFYSALILAIRYNDSNTPGVAYHTLILADTGGDIPVFQQNIDGRTLDIQRTPSDAYDRIFKDTIASVVRAAYPNTPAEKIYNAEVEILPKGYDYKNIDQVRRTVVNALKAAGTILNVSTPGYKHISLDDYAKSNMVARLAFNQGQITDTTGLPVRADVRIDFSEVINDATTRPGEVPSLNTGEASVKAFAIHGYTDLIYSPDPHLVPASPFAAPIAPQANQSQYMYTPRFVITNMDADVLNTIPGTLLGLVTVMTMYENANWMGAFKRDPGSVPKRDEFDPRDIGAIGIEINGLSQPNGIGPRFETRTDSFNDAVLAGLLRAYVRPRLVISMDVPETGATTWLTSIFLAAAEGERKADAELRMAADILTKGRFSQLLPASTPLVIADNTRIHMGYYDDARTRVRRDIRDVDYLTAQNMFGETDPEMARRYSDSYNRNDVNGDVRLNDRRNVIQHCLGPSTTYTGWAKRVTFTGEGLVALATAVHQCGLVIRSQTPFQDLTGQPRAAAGWLDQVALQNGGGNLFQGRAFGGGGNSYNDGRGNYSRWS